MAEKSYSTSLLIGTVAILFAIVISIALRGTAITTTATGMGTTSAMPASLSSPFSRMEEIFLDVPNPISARSSLHFITRIPHVAGTSGDYLMAEFVSTEFIQAGIPNVTTYDLTVFLNYPKSPPTLELFEPKETGQDQDDDDDDDHDDVSADQSTTTKLPPPQQQQRPQPPHRLIYRATLSEDLLDATIDDTTDTDWRNMTFHGYSASGTVEGVHLIYANYGRPQDFDVLTKAGISVKGRIVLVRYGLCFRGLKVRNAEQRGALGVLIYSDPADDGYVKGPTYPNGPWRPESSIQRGSVQYNSRCAGDPMRADPRYSTILNTSVQQLCGVDSPHEMVPSIPSLPLSYRDALPLLQNLGGPVAADVPGGTDFVGGLTNLTYRLGPSRGVLNMHVNNEEVVTTIPNVVGVIPGSLPPDKDMPILLGNHRDAWVYGAADPNSGTATLLELAKGLGKLYTDHNWRPLRTIYLLSWSGEEYGLLGSTGWAELNAPLIHRALAYLNCDTVVSGDKLKVSSSPSLVSLWKGVMEDLNSTTFSTTGTTTTTTTRPSLVQTMATMTVSDTMHHQQRIMQTYDNSPYGDIHDANTDWEIPVNDTADEFLILGSGSDYTVFLDHFGIPSLDFSFGKRTGMYGVYHSVYDSFAWVDKYGGRDGEPGSAFHIMAFSARIWGLMAIRLSSADLVPLDHIDQGRSLGKYLLHIQEGDPDSKVDLHRLVTAVDAYQKAAAKIQLSCSSNKNDKNNNTSGTETHTIDDCNERLGLTERMFLMEDGLPDRPWFKHCLQAPGLDLGYGASAFPGIQQALDDGNYTLAQEQVDVTAGRVQAAADHLMNGY